MGGCEGESNGGAAAAAAAAAAVGNRLTGTSLTLPFACICNSALRAAPSRSVVRLCGCHSDFEVGWPWPRLAHVVGARGGCCCAPLSSSCVSCPPHLLPCHHSKLQSPTSCCSAAPRQVGKTRLPGRLLPSPPPARCCPAHHLAPPVAWTPTMPTTSEPVMSPLSVAAASLQ